MLHSKRFLAIITPQQQTTPSFAEALFRYPTFYKYLYFLEDNAGVISFISFLGYYSLETSDLLYSKRPTHRSKELQTHCHITTITVLSSFVNQLPKQRLNPKSIIIDVLPVSVVLIGEISLLRESDVSLRHSTNLSYLTSHPAMCSHFAIFCVLKSDEIYI